MNCRNHKEYGVRIEANSRVWTAIFALEPFENQVQDYHVNLNFNTAAVFVAWHRNIQDSIPYSQIKFIDLWSIQSPHHFDS